MRADGIDHDAGRRMGDILAQRGVRMSGYWASREELESAWRHAMNMPYTMLGKPCSYEPSLPSR